MIKYFINHDEIILEYKDEVFEYIQELQVRIFRLILTLLLIYINYLKIRCFLILIT
jgi:hypothetical protein